MSDVGSLELCKELFELSGWTDTYFCYSAYGKQWSITHGRQSSKIEKCPAYSLGYLLRKLPNEATSKKYGGYHYLYLHHGKQDWYAYYGAIDTTEFMAAGDTPEDAACKLAIELWKQGILNPTGDHK